VKDISEPSPASGRQAKATLYVIAGFAVGGLVLSAISRGKGGAGPLGLVGLAMGLIGALIVRRAQNVIGWFFLASGVGLAVSAFTDAFVSYSLLARHTPLPWTSFAGWLNNISLAVVATPLLLLILFFPTGRIPSRRWRPVVWIWMGALGVLVPALAIRPGEVFGTPAPNGIDVANPIGVAGAESVLGPAITAAVTALVIVGAISVLSLVIRFVRSRGEERQQLKWLVYVVSLILILFLILFVIDAVTGDNPAGTVAWISSMVWGAFALLFAIGIPGAVVVAVLRYRLYGIDVVINKTLVYGALAAFITAVYVGIVVGIGAAIGQGSSQPNLGLSILATGVVAVAFQPVRERVQRFANRLVYGKRATPYEVLSEFGHRMAGTYAADDVLPRMARILAEGTGAKQARVWLAFAGELTPAASWPDTGANGSSARPDGADLLVEVTHQGEELGALSISKAPGERLAPAEEKLTKDLASQAGLVLRNVRLIEDLKASRVRLVQAQDQERRRIERNIHDGAQQQLVALNVKLGLARRLTADPSKLDSILTQLQEETNQALADLRDLARGIYPPLLADQGLIAALEAQARKAPLPVTVMADGVDRYSQDVEAAVYFCVLEALQNVAKYAGATMAAVTLSASEGHFAFTVTDDGAGFDPSTTSYGTGLQGMADRLAALGGQIEVRSRPGAGTTAIGQIPVRSFEPV
jgi:signal transduction histidine kinase